MKNHASAVWPGWETGSRIGKGGFGAVYEIHRDVYGYKETCALKVITIPQDFSEIDYLRCSGVDEQSISHALHDQVEKILAEYTLMSRMRGNPHIVHVDDFREQRHRGDPGWDILIKMELLTPLMKALDRFSGESEIVRLGCELCLALDACQQQSIIHRDIKPQNIFLSSEGHYKLGDFGIARVRNHTTNVTEGVGTYSYMAPEVARNEQYDQTADLYSLGLVLYWLLNERRGPFMPLPPAIPSSDDNENAKQRRYTGEPLPDPKNGSAGLVAVVRKACAPDPNDRYQTAREMLDALNAIPADEQTVISPPSDLQKPEKDADPTLLNTPHTPVIPDTSEPEPDAEYELSGFRLRGSILIGYTGAPETVVFPKDMWIRKIGREVFAGRSDLKTVQFPDRLDSIAYGAFRDCPALEKVTFPEGLKTIGDTAFRNCTAIKRLHLREGLTELGMNAFSCCTQLQQLRLPKTLLTIEGGCFMDCRKLASLSLPEGLVQIGESAFCRTGVTQIQFPKSLRQLGECAFGYCGSLTRAVFQPGIQALDLSAFCNCRSLQSIVIPDTVQTLLPSGTPPDHRIEICASSKWIEAHQDFFYRNPHYIPVKSDSLSGVTRKLLSTGSTPTAAAFLTQWQKLSKKEKLHFLWGSISLTLLLLAFLISDIYALCVPDCGAMILRYPLPILALQLLAPLGQICALWIIWKQNPNPGGKLALALCLAILISLPVLFMAVLFSYCLLDQFFVAGFALILSGGIFCFRSFGLYAPVSEKNPPCTLMQPVFLPNHEGKSAIGLTYHMNQPVIGCVSLKISLNICTLDHGCPDGTWQIHVRDRRGQWHHLGCFEAKKNRGEFFAKYDKPISFDAYACTAYKTAPWHGTMTAKLDFVSCVPEKAK